MEKNIVLKLAFNFITNIIYNDSQYEISKMALYLIGLMGSLLPFSYAALPQISQSQENYFVIIIAKFARPYLFLSQDSSFFSYIDYGIYALFGILVVNYCLQIFQEQQQNQYQFLRVFQIVNFHINQILDVWLINIILELTLMKQQLLSYIVTSFFILLLIQRLIITKVSIEFKYYSFNNQNDSIFIYIQQLLNLTQIAIFSIDPSQEEFRNVQVVLSTLICAFNNINILLNMPQVNTNLLFIQFFTHINTMIYCLSFLVFNNTGNTNGYEPQILFIITWPFCLKFAYFFRARLLCNQFTFLNQKFIFIHYFFTHHLQQFDLKSMYFQYSLQQTQTYNLTKTEQTKLHNQQFQLQLYKLFDHAPEKQLHLSLLLLLQEYFTAYQYQLGKHEKQSIISNAKSKIMKQVVLNELRNQMLTNNSIQLNNILIDSLISVETQSIQCSEKLIHCCQKKVDFHQICLSNQRKSDIQKQADEIVELFEETIQQIETSYKQYPLVRYQRCLSFGYAELCNDILLAIRILNQSSFPDEFIYTKILTINQDFLSYKSIYLISNLENQNVLKVSSNFYEKIGDNIQNIMEMVPKGIQEHHQVMVREFIRTGKSNFFQKATQTIYQDNLMIKPMILMNDVIIQDNTFHAISIGTLLDDEQIILITNNKSKVSSFSQGFLDQINLESKDANQILGVDIELLIPQFRTISQISQPQYIEVKLPNFSLLQSHQVLNGRENNKKPHPCILADFWSDNSRLNTFISLCLIEKSTYNYHKIRFSYIKCINKTIIFPNSMKTLQKLSVNCFDEVEEQVNIAVPYDPIDQECNFAQKQDMLNTVRYDQTQTLIKYDDTRTDGMKRIGQSTQKYEENSIERFINQNAKSSTFDKDIKQNYEMKLYQKYSLFEKIRHKNNLVKTEKMLIVVLALHQLLFFLQILLTFIDCINLLSLNLNDLELLKIKYDLFQPVETFIVTRYTIINYNNQFAAKQITKPQLDFYLKFPNSNLNLGFDDVYQNQEAILNRLELQSFLSEVYEIYIYVKTDNGELYNITMRQALSILINYQYTFKAAYVYDGKTVTDSPYIFYSYRNLLTLYNSFDQLNKNLYSQAILKISDDLEKELFLFYPFLIQFIVIFGVELFYDFKNNKILGKFVYLILYCHSVLILQEIRRLTCYIDYYINNPEKLFKYKFIIEEKEQELQSTKELNSSGAQQKKLQNIGKSHFKKCHIITLFLQLILIITYGIIKLNLTSSYLNKYEKTCQFTIEISHLGTNIPTIYAMREVLYYRWRYPFYKEKELSEILQQIQDCLEQVHNVTNDISQLRINDYLLSDSFGQYIQELYQTNLCDLLPEDLKERSQQLCQSTLGGSLRKGLYGALVYIYTSIQNEMQINYFLNKTENTVNELEGVFMVSQIIKQINSKMWLDIVDSTEYIYSLMEDELDYLYSCLQILGKYQKFWICNSMEISKYLCNLEQQIVSIVSFIYIFFVIINLIAIFILINNKLQRQYYLSKRYLYLVPQAILFGNDQFERLAKGLLQMN